MSPLSRRALALGLLLSLALAGLASCRKPRDDRDARPVRRPAPTQVIEIRATEYHKGWTEALPHGPRHAAWQSWNGKPVRVTGEIARIGELLGQPEVALRADQGEVICAIAPGARDQLEPLRVGAEVTLQGTAEGWLLGPVLRDCALPPSPP